MMMRRFSVKSIFAAAVAVSLLAASCTKSEYSGYTATPVPVGEERFVVSARISSSGAYYLLLADDLESGSLSLVNNGEEVKDGNVIHFVGNEYMYSINEAGGTDGAPVYCYELDGASGRIKQVGSLFQTTAFNSWGHFVDNLVYLRYLTNSAETARNITDVAGVTIEGVDYYPVYQYLTFADPNSGNPYPYIETAEEFLLGSYMSEADKSPETVNFPCYVEANGKMYVSVATTGVSGYTVAGSNFTTAMSNLISNESLTGNISEYISTGHGYATMGASGNTSKFSVEGLNRANVTGGVGFPLTPDKARIAVYNPSSTQFNMLTSPNKVITTDLIGQAYGRYLSNPLSTIVTNADESYVYVFSPGITRAFNDTEYVSRENGGKEEYIKQYETYNSTLGTYETLSSTNYRKVVSDSKAGVVRINTTTDEVDTSWGTSGLVELEDSYLNGCTFTRVWHISGDKFLLRVMDTAYTTAQGYYYWSHKNTPVDTRFAIFDASTKSLTYVTGLPVYGELMESNSSAIAEPLATSDKIYIPYSLQSASYIYVVDVETAAATQGAAVTTNYLYGVGKLIAK